jgi:hypothetical protein
LNDAGHFAVVKLAFMLNLTEHCIRKD